MAGIGELSVFITAHTKKAQKNIGDFRKSLQSTRKVAGQASKAFKTLSGITAGLSFAGAAYAIKSAMTDLDGLAKTSDKLGILPEKLAGIRHAAEQTGVSVSTADMALQRMTRRISEASVGKGEAKSALKELGLDAQLLNQQSPDVVLGKVADALNSIDNQSDKLRLSMKLFDSEGVAFVNTLKLGEKGLAAMAAEAGKLGIAPSRDELARIEAANDSMDRAAKSIKGAFASAATVLAPAMEGAADYFTETIKQTIDGWKAIQEESRIEAAARIQRKFGDRPKLRELYDSDLRTAEKMRQFGMGKGAAFFEGRAAMNARDVWQALKDNPERLKERFAESPLGYRHGKTAAQFIADMKRIQESQKRSAEIQAASAAKKAKADTAAAQSAADNAARWTSAIKGMSEVGKSFTKRMEASASVAGFQLDLLGRSAARMFKTNKVEPRQTGLASLRSATAGTRAEYAIRADMSNRARSEEIRTQQEQLATQQQIAENTQQQVAATEAFASEVGQAVGSALGGLFQGV